MIRGVSMCVVSIRDFVATQPARESIGDEDAGEGFLAAAQHEHVGGGDVGGDGGILGVDLDVVDRDTALLDGTARCTDDDEVISFSCRRWSSISVK